MLNSTTSTKTISTEARKLSGIHLMLTLHDCAAEILNDRSRLTELVRQAALATGATILDTHSYQFEPHGITALAALAESHASLHTYPESRTVFWDCFTCSSKTNPELSVQILVDALRPGSINKQLIFRR